MQNIQQNHISIPNKPRVSVHPGTILEKEFMEPLGITVMSLSKHTNIRTVYLSRLINGSEEINVSVALRLAKTFNTTPEFWLDLSKNHFKTKLENDEGYSRLLNNIKPL